MGSVSHRDARLVFDLLAQDGSAGNPIRHYLDDYCAEEYLRPFWEVRGNRSVDLGMVCCLIQHSGESLHPAGFPRRALLFPLQVVSPYWVVTPYWVVSQCLGACLCWAVSPCLVDLRLRWADLNLRWADSRHRSVDLCLRWADLSRRSVVTCLTRTGSSRVSDWTTNETCRRRAIHRHRGWHRLGRLLPVLGRVCRRQETKRLR